MCSHHLPGSCNFKMQRKQAFLDAHYRNPSDAGRSHRPDCPWVSGVCLRKTKRQGRAQVVSCWVFIASSFSRFQWIYNTCIRCWTKTISKCQEHSESQLQSYRNLRKFWKGTAEQAELVTYPPVPSSGSHRSSKNWSQEPVPELKDTIIVH